MICPAIYVTTRRIKCLLNNDMLYMINIPLQSAVKDHLSSVIRGSTATIPVQRRPAITVSEAACAEIKSAAFAAAGSGSAAYEESSDAAAGER
jgi:hypothetical protein